jgi:galactose mutarotase-like enzyme
MYKVINLDDKTVYFSLGAHPAFNVPFGDDEQYENYFVEFEKTETLISHQLNNEGFFNGETETIASIENKLPLTQDLFKNDALVFKTLASRKVSINSTRHNKQIALEYPHFNYLGLWAKPGAPFLCVEPWLGCADFVGAQTEFSKKEAIQHVEHGHVFETEFSIRIINN